MKQYLLSVMHDGDYPTPTPEVMQQMFEGVERFNAHLQETGAWLFAGGLLPKQDARTVRFSDGSTVVSDGPFTQCSEQMGGFWVIQAEDADAALELAEQAARACQGDVEVRPFQDGG